MRETKKSKASFQIRMLSKIINMDKYPLIKLVIESDLEEKEYEDLFALVKRLNVTYEQQKEEGLLNFTSLLVEFAGMLNEKLNPDQTIHALRKENYFPELMDEFVKIIREEEAKWRRRK